MEKKYSLIAMITEHVDDFLMSGTQQPIRVVCFYNLCISTTVGKYFNLVPLSGELH